LRTARRLGPNIVAVTQIEAVAARHGPWPTALHPSVRAAAATLGIEALYSHQATATELALDGRHVAVVSGTASGKSLCYLLPLLHTLVTVPGARALWLFPTKALAHDQLAALHRWAAALPPGTVRPAAYDGDTPTGRRTAIRRQANVVVSNPDMLHTAILPHHTDWADFLTGLSQVVVDEMHVYRGVFGGHVANVLRRLRRVGRFYGAVPRLPLTSATVANPAELARLLTGEAVAVVAEDGAPRGRRTFVFYNPPVIDPSLGLRRSSLLEAETLAATLLAHDVQTVVFARSRLSVEVLLTYLRERAAKQNDEGGTMNDERRGRIGRPTPPDSSFIVHHSSFANGASRDFTESVVAGD